ncbi:MAG: CDP-glucose 4,6-dehydratase [Deltaproteobacteria bacterium]|nr:CDP-glucose 4,6-dehydratase [Deltaproteobacteria bacterium]
MQDFWKNKRVLITGHTGFKGTWLVHWLKLMGAQVAGFALLPPTSPSLFELSCASQDMISVVGDVRDLKALKDIVCDFHPEIILHLAAQALVRQSYSDPAETYSTNIMGTVHLFEAVRSSKGVRAVVNVTSDKCYENREWMWGYRETDAMGGYDPYSCSKGCSELVTASYRNAFFNPDQYDRHGVGVASARAGNVIGGGDWATDRLIPDIIKAFMRNRTVEIRSPNAIRPWQHVLEPLSGYLCLAESLYREGARHAQAWNFGPSENDVKSVGWVVERMTSLWGGDARFEMDVKAHPHEAGCLKLDCAKARTLLGWSPRLNLEQALEWTLDWYRAYHKNPLSCRDMMTAQILRYQELTNNSLKAQRSGRSA